MSYPVNAYQTPITDELLASLNQEVKDELLDAINNIPFIQSLISPERKLAKELTRDEQGRIIVDVCHPHILQDMDYFRPTGNHFRKYGTLTNLRPNANPNSEFGKWIKEETRRIWEGYVRLSDGEWVTGDMYFYLNYTPILQSKVRKGTKKADRVIDFPEVWECTYLWFHYIDQARNGGLYNDFLGGQHCVHIARRGAGKSYSSAAMLAKLFVCGENEESNKSVRGLATAYQKEYLIKDGLLNKFVDAIDFCAEFSQFPSRRLKSSIQELTWKMGYLDADTGVTKGTGNEVMGVSSKDDSDKLRGKRANKIILEEFGAFAKFIDVWNTLIPSVQEGDISFGQLIAQGTGGTTGSDFSGALEIIYNPVGYGVYALPNVFDRNSQGKQKTVFFTGGYMNRKGFYNQDGVTDVTGALLSIIEDRFKVKYNSTDPLALTRRKAEIPITIQDAIMKIESTIYPVSDLTDVVNNLDQNPKSLDDVWVGRLEITKERQVVYKPDASLRPVRDFPHKDNKLEGAIEIFVMPELDRGGKIYSGRYIGGCLLPGEKVMTDQGLVNVEEVTFTHKLINELGELVSPKALLIYDKIEEPVYTVKVSNTYRTTTFTKEHPILSCTPKLNYHHQSTCKRLGILQRERTYPFSYRTVDQLQIGDYIKIPNIYKRQNMDISHYWLNDSQNGFNINNPIFKEDFWWLVGLWLGDGWCNTDKIYISFNKKEQEYIQKFLNATKGVFHRSPSVAKDKGTCVEYCFGNRELSRFLTKHFGKYAQGKYLPEWVKYVSPELKLALLQGYLDSDGCIQMGRHGATMEFVSISLELLEGFQDILFSLGIISSISKLRDPGIHIINDKECKIQLTFHLRITHNELCKFLQYSLWPRDHKIQKISGIERKLNSEKTILNCFFDETEDFVYFKVKEVTPSIYTGKVYNFECETHTFMCHHITTHNCDPYDDDSSETLSLGSIKVLDLWTDEIVCQYTGRPQFADDFYETCRRILLFYNATCNYENNKKGLFAYFSKMNSLYLLTDTLDFLKDREMVKGQLYGNKAHPYSQKVYTPQGIKNWGQLQVGDQVYGTNGQTTNIISIPFDQETDIYEITLKDGRKVQASEDHLWKVIDWNGYEKTMSTKQLQANYFRNKGKYVESKYYIPKNEGVNFPEQELPLPPYFIGIMLGDGSFVGSKGNRADFTSSISDLQTYLKFVPYEVITYDDRHHKFILPQAKQIFDNMGLGNAGSHTKFIPDTYKYNTRDNRLELLRGLLDTDGCIDYGGNPSYCTVSKQLCLDIIEVARSLGINCNYGTNYNSYGPYYKVLFYTDVPLFHLERKRSRQKLTKTRSYKTAITGISFVKREKAKCVTVDSEDNCYLIGDFITTHNSKGSPATAPIKAYYRRCIRDWLLKPVTVIQQIDGETMEVTVPLLTKLKQRALLKELTLWNADGNFDEHDALGMLMLLREDRLRLLGEQDPKEASEKAEANYLGDDNFFKKNYDDRFKKSSTPFPN